MQNGITHHKSRPTSVLGRSLPTAWVAQGDILIAIKAYFDKSGQDNSPFLTLSGVAAGENVWADIERHWQRILHDRQPKAEYVHMRDVLGLQRAFDQRKGWTHEKVSQLIFNLLDYLQFLNKKTYHHFSCSVDLLAHKKLMAEGYKLDSPIELCNQYCVEPVLHWYLFEYPELDLSAHYFFDQGEPFVDSFKSKWEKTVKDSEQEEGGYTVWSAIKSVATATMKATPGLQIADVLAWASNREQVSIAPRYFALCETLRQIIPSQWIIWDELKFRQNYTR